MFRLLVTDPDEEKWPRKPRYSGKMITFAA